ncbi:MAG TPA: membrane protein insertase YidC [Candidatus Cybelea sp.]|nr:membrane protein insertase YidC [Candidatus Cybelea sp.]
MENKNLIVAIVLSALIVVGWQYFFELPRIHQQQAALQQQQQQQAAQQPLEPQASPSPTAQSPATAGAAPTTGATVIAKTRDEALQQSPRISLETPRLKGSIALKGGRLDDLVLKGYRQSVDPESPMVDLLSPGGGPLAYFAEVGYLATDANVKVPGPDTVWQADGTALTPDKPVTLTWDNGAGLLFKRVFSVDQNYMFSVEQSVENKSGAAVSLAPYTRVVRFGLPADYVSSIVHEGPIGVVGGTLQGTGIFSNPWSYPNIKKHGQDNAGDAGIYKQDTQGGWLGIADKYWLVAQILPADVKASGRAFYDPKSDSYQTDFTGAVQQVAPGASSASNYQVFAGVKEASLLRSYRDNLHIPLFERSIDFGIYWFLTEPLQWFLIEVYHFFGNFGIAILCLTVLVKGAMFPLANKSYMSMSKMKTLQPKMAELKEKYGDDKQRMQSETMALYKREKVNPMAGCLPMFVQVPVFYSLYKVFSITIEMRHAPFFGWIKDLSAPDPTTLLNLFGIIPWNPADYLHLPMIGQVLLYISIGVWPLVMGFTMWMQMRLNPTPPDPVQARMFQIMPIMFTLMLGHFASGLVIYWAWNNTLSIIQQRYIMRKLDKAREKKKD